MDVLEGLNEAQREAVLDLDHNILLSAPAGTGKTRILACRTAQILAAKRAEGAQILCLTFTNRACKELQRRILTIVKEKGLDVIVKTIHSFCYSILKEETKHTAAIFSDFLVYDDPDCKTIISTLTASAPVPLYESKKLQKLQNFIEQIKKFRVLNGPCTRNRQEDYASAVHTLLCDSCQVQKLCRNYDGSYDTAMEQWLATNGLTLLCQYDAALSANHAVDFADLITGVCELFHDPEICRRWRERFAYISVDEMQDTSEIEYALISQLFPGRNILLCGDYFQTIYEWRGSYPDLILRRFTENYKPRRITFTVNYRSTQLLLHATAACLVNLFGPPAASVRSVAAASDPGLPIIVHEAAQFMDEARWIFQEILKLPPTDWPHICIMTRTNPQNKQIWNGVRSHNETLPPDRRLPFTMIDQFQLFKRQESKDVIAFLRLLIHKNDTISLTRILKRFSSRIGSRTIMAIESPSYHQLGIRLTDFIDPSAHTFHDPFGLLLHALEQERIVVFDVESTGTDIIHDEIIQIAAIRLNTQGRTAEKFTAYVRPSRNVGTSFYVHHISDEQLARDGKDPRIILPALLDFIKDGVIVGHNVTYDLSILHSELRRLHIPAPAGLPYYDTLDLFRRFYPNLPNHTLSFLSTYFALDDKPSHDAFDDILATAALLRYAIRQHIRPQTGQRCAAMAIYLPLFRPVSQEMQQLYRQSYVKRPYEMISAVMNDCRIKEYYEKHADRTDGENHIDRIENIRRLYRVAQETDSPDKDPRDCLNEFIQMTALSNSELDSLLEKKPQIPIITIHQAKGLEFTYVFLAGLQEGTFPLSRSQSGRELEEEKRLFYVAVTRAKKRLYLSWHRQDGSHRRQPSRFIAAIPDSYKEIQP